ALSKDAFRMNPTTPSHRRRWLFAALPLLLLGVACVRGTGDAGCCDEPRDAACDACDACAVNMAEAPNGPNNWPMYGGTINRNMVNTTDKNIPASWSVEEGKTKSVKWVAALGSSAYGGPVISGGKVFVSTNNEIPRDPNLKGDKGVLMCFRESDGKFL